MSSGGVEERRRTTVSEPRTAPKPSPLGVPDGRACVCGHAGYEHAGLRSCHPGTKTCGCGCFRECFHPSLKAWRTRFVCTTCGQVQEEGAA